MGGPAAIPDSWGFKSLKCMTLPYRAVFAVLRDMPHLTLSSKP